VKYYRTASARIPRETYEAFEEKCNAEGCTIHAKLKDFIDSSLSQEKKNVRTERRLEKSDADTNQRRIERLEAPGPDTSLPPFLR